MGSGKWLEKALLELSLNAESAVEMDSDLILGLVSFCELAPPPDAADYLKNIIGMEAGQHVIQEYMQRRGYVDPSASTSSVQISNLQTYVKPATEINGFAATKKQTRTPKEATLPNKNQTGHSGPTNDSRGTSSGPKKKKTGKAISLAEAAKGSVVFKQGQPCSCQARRHKLVSNCLSCGKIVCEQEGEGPCNFCGSLVLREGSTYAGLDDIAGPLSDAEAAAEAYAKRLVDYDRNSAARTTVIDDQSDYFEMEGNSWLSGEEKELLLKKQQEIREADEARKKKVVVTFDLVGRKVILNQDDALELELENRILRPPEERELNRIKPNLNVKIQPVFVNTGHARTPVKGKENFRVTNDLCLEISGRVQHVRSELRHFAADGQRLNNNSEAGLWPGSQTINDGDAPECSIDYN